jgi:putative sigma-54 modulation protein
MMQLTVKGKNVQIDDRLRDYVDKRASKLDRYLPEIQEVKVDLSVENTRSSQDRQVAQITVRSNGTILRAEERAEEMSIAIDAVLDKIIRQIARFKGKRADRWHGQSSSRPEEMDLLPISEDVWDSLAQEEERQIVRVKRFAVSTMDENEAIEQMELLGHDFFIYFNPDSGMLNVLYRRHDGNYGLLEPEVA